MRLYGIRLLMIGITLGTGYLLTAFYYERKLDTNVNLVKYYREQIRESDQKWSVCQDKIEPKNPDDKLAGTWVFNHEPPEFCLLSIDPDRGNVQYCYKLPKTYTALNILDSLDRGFGRQHLIWDGWTR